MMAIYTGAALKGPVLAVVNGDTIAYDTAKRSLNVEV